MLSLSSSNPAVLELGERELTWQTEDGSIALPVPAIASAGTATVTGRASVYYCRTGSEALCLVQSIDITLPVEVREGATAGEISGEVRLPPVED